MVRHLLVGCCIGGLVARAAFADNIELPNFKNAEAKKAKSRYDEAAAKGQDRLRAEAPGGPRGVAH